jgi:phage-related protein
MRCPCGYVGPPVSNDRPDDRETTPAAPYCPACLRNCDEVAA